MSYDDQFRAALTKPGKQWQEIQYLIKLGADPSTKTSDGENLLHIAIRSKWNKTSMLATLDLGVAVNETNRQGLSALALYLTVSRPIYTDIVKKMIQAGADPDTTDSSGKDLVEIALANNCSSSYVNTVLKMGIGAKRMGSSAFDSLTKTLMAPDRIVHLAKIDNRKEAVLAHIRRLPLSEQIAAVDEALNYNTQLGKFFAVRRSWLSEPSRSSGTLAQLVALRQELVEMDLEAETMAKGTFLALTRKTLTQDTIVRLAKTSNRKEDVLDYIAQLPLMERKTAVELALDNRMPLNQFFATKRSWFPTSETRGSLARLVAMQNEINRSIRLSPELEVSPPGTSGASSSSMMAEYFPQTGSASSTDTTGTAPAFSEVLVKKQAQRQPSTHQTDQRFIDTWFLNNLTS